MQDTRHHDATVADASALAAPFAFTRGHASALAVPAGPHPPASRTRPHPAAARNALPLTTPELTTLISRIASPPSGPPS